MLEHSAPKGSLLCPRPRTQSTIQVAGRTGRRMAVAVGKVIFGLHLGE